MVNETGNRNRILEMSKFLTWIRLGITSTIHQIMHEAQKCFHIDDYCLRQNGNSLTILQVCRLRFRQFSGSGDHIFSTYQHQIPCTNRIQQCWLCIQWWMKLKIEIGFQRCANSVFGFDQVLRPHFFTDFQILHAVHTCGPIDACFFLWDKPEVVCQF